MEHINFEKYEVNEELREITFSCASDTPYERYDFESALVYNEILVISEDAVDLSRLNNSAPLLFNHDCNKLLGMVEKAYIIENKVFVKVRFSRNDDFADRIFKDILDGVIKNVSIGYQIEAYEDKKENGVYNRYVTKWMIFETSIVSIPADASVGIRSKNIKEVKTMEENKPIETPAETAPEAPEEKELETVAEAEAEVAEEMAELEALKQENEALKLEVEKLERLLADDETPAETAPEEKELDDAEKEEIEKIGADFDIPQEEIKSAIDKKLSVREFKKQIKTKTFNIKEKEIENMNRKEFREFLQARNFDNPFVMRDFSGFTSAALVGTQTMSLEEALNRKIAIKGYRTLTGLNNNVAIPVQKGRIAINKVGINEASTDSNPTFETVTLTPQKFVGSTLISKELLANSNSNIESFVVDSLLKEIAYKIEAYMLQKVAEAYITEINYSSLDGISWRDVLMMEAAVDSFELENKKFVTSPGAVASLKSIPRAANANAGFICEDGYINGYEVAVSGCTENDNIYFADWSQLVMGTWQDSSMEILIDPFSHSRQGAILVVASTVCDCAIIQPSAFAIGKVQS